MPAKSAIPEWKKFMDAQVSAGEPVTLADLRQRGYKGSPSGVRAVTNGEHVNKGGPRSSSKFPSTLPSSRDKADIRSVKNILNIIGATGTTVPRETGPLGESDGTLRISTGDSDGGGYPGPGKSGTSKVLGQLEPAAATEATLYTTPADTTTTVKQIVVTNRGNRTNFSLGVAVGGGSLADEDHLFDNTDIKKGQTAVIEGPFYLNATDLIRVESVTGNVAFSAWGTEWA